MGIDVVTLALAKGYTDGKIRDADFGEVPLDTSLTKKGQAADAKAVGDAISKLSGGNVAYDEAQTLTDEQKAQARENIGAQPAGDYLENTALTTAINTALAQAKESGEFDGADGQPGKDGEPGKDYVLTNEDKTEIAELAADLVKVPSDEHINDLINTALGVIENGTY